MCCTCFHRFDTVHNQYLMCSDLVKRSVSPLLVRYVTVEKTADFIIIIVVVVVIISPNVDLCWTFVAEEGRREVES